MRSCRRRRRSVRVRVGQRVVAASGAERRVRRGTRRRVVAAETRRMVHQTGRMRHLHVVLLLQLVVLLLLLLRGTIRSDIGDLVHKRLQSRKAFAGHVLQKSLPAVRIDQRDPM